MKTRKPAVTTPTPVAAPKAPLTRDDVMRLFERFLDRKIEDARYDISRTLDARQKTLTKMIDGFSQQTSADNSIGNALFELQHPSSDRGLHESAAELIVYVTLKDRYDKQRSDLGNSFEAIIGHVIDFNQDQAIHNNDISNMSSSCPFSNAIAVSRGIGRQRAIRDAHWQMKGYLGMLAEAVKDPLCD